MIRPSAPRTIDQFRMMLAAALLATVAASAFAQVPPPANPLVIGVEVDGDGLMTGRQVTTNPKLLAARKAALAKAQQDARANGNKESLGYVSLPRLFTEARQCVDAGKELPEKLRYLGGMTKMRYVFVFPEEKDLVIAGDVEPYDRTDETRPTGLRTGRPVLQLDDLVVVLRLVGPGNIRGSFGCSIDPDAGAMKTVEDIIKDPANRNVSKTKKAEMMAQAVGPHTVRYVGQKPDTRVAYVCVEADYILKRLAMGVDKSPVAAVQHKHQNERLQFNGMWFTPSFEPLLVSPDGTAFEIRGQSLQLNARGAQFRDAPPTPGTAAYAKLFTKHFPQLAAAVPAFADLWNITDLAFVATLIGHDKLHDKIGWNLDWVLDPRGYPLAKVRVARTADTLAFYATGAYIVGGVELGLLEFVGPKARQRDEDGKAKDKRARPEQGQWQAVK